MEIIGNRRKRNFLLMLTGMQKPPPLTTRLFEITSCSNNLPRQIWFSSFHKLPFSAEKRLYGVKPFFKVSLVSHLAVVGQSSGSRHAVVRQSTGQFSSCRWKAFQSCSYTSTPQENRNTPSELISFHYERMRYRAR